MRRYLSLVLVLLLIVGVATVSNDAVVPRFVLEVSIFQSQFVAVWFVSVRESQIISIPLAFPNGIG